MREEGEGMGRYEFKTPLVWLLLMCMFVVLITCNKGQREVRTDKVGTRFYLFVCPY
jgi:hypothetical protein